MSSISEALARAALRTTPSRRGIALVPDPAADSYPLEHYPRERPPSAPGGEESVLTPPDGDDPRATAASSLDEVLDGRTASGVLEQCRRVAGLLQEARVTRRLKSVAVTSSTPGEGKTLTVLSLALAMTQSGARVLLIDADVQRPSLHEVFGIGNDRGLSDELRGGLAAPPIVDLSALLSVLTAGHADANTLPSLTPDRLRLLLDEQTPNFDWVLLDAPCVGGGPDAALLARRVSGVVFVIGDGTPFQAAEAALAQLDRSRVIATVLAGLSDVMASAATTRG